MHCDGCGKQFFFRSPLRCLRRESIFTWRNLPSPTQTRPLCCSTCGRGFASTDDASSRNRTAGAEGDPPIASADGAVVFVVRAADSGVYVERIEPLQGIGRLSHLMRFDDVDSFVKAYEADHLRHKYPHIYSRLLEAVEQSLGGG